MGTSEHGGQHLRWPEPPEVAEARRLDRAKRRIRVLVTVKASPQPSRSYGDTVCVAGIALDPLRWVRLYPVPFRHLEGPQKFEKYTLIDVDVRDAGSDKRPESLRIDAHSLRVHGQSLPPWKKRIPFVEPLVGGTLCGLQAAVREDVHAPSLAAVRPLEVQDLLFERHRGWTAEQVSRFEEYVAQGDLFRKHDPELLEAPRFRVKLRFTCRQEGCTGHAPSIIDWELTALQQRFRDRPVEELKSAVRDKFFRMMYRRGTAPAIFLGNQEAPTRRQQFMVLGTYYPQTIDMHVADTLF